MKTSSKVVTNKRTGEELGHHVLFPHANVDLITGDVAIAIHSFKSGKVEDSYVRGNIQPQVVSSAVIKEVDLSANVKEAIEKYFDENVESIVSGS